MDSEEFFHLIVVWLQDLSATLSRSAKTQAQTLPQQFALLAVHNVAPIGRLCEDLRKRGGAISTVADGPRGDWHIALTSTHSVDLGKERPVPDANRPDQTPLLPVARSHVMLLRLMTLLFLTIVSSATSWCQETKPDSPQVDQSKLLVGQIWQLSDPTTQQEVLLPLYKTLRQIEQAQGGLGLEMQTPEAKTNLLELLQNRAVQQEIGMEEYQYKELQRQRESLRESIVEDVRTAMQSGKRNPEELIAMIHEIKKRGDREIQNAVLPHQWERLRQVAFQTLIRSQDPAHVLTNEPFKSQLGLDPQESERLRQRSRELHEEFERQVEELRQETLNKLLEELDPEQREKVQALIGDELDLTSLKRAAKEEVKNQGEKVDD